MPGPVYALNLFDVSNRDEYLAYSRRSDLPAQDFHIGRHPVLIALGVVMTAAFAVALGPTIYLH